VSRAERHLPRRRRVEAVSSGAVQWLLQLDARQRTLGAMGVVVAVVVAVAVVLATSGSDGVATGDQPSSRETSERLGEASRGDVTSTSDTADTADIAESPAATRAEVTTDGEQLASTTSTAPGTTTGTSSTTSISTTSTTIDPGLQLPTLSEGDESLYVAELQQMLINVTGAEIAADGVYGPSTTTAVRNFQRVFGLPVTGDADHETRQVLRYVNAARSDDLPAWKIPPIGNGGANGCQVAVIGDSLMAGSGALHERALRDINCASAVDGVGGRSLSYGWQCRITQPSGSRPLLLVPEPPPGNDTCSPSGLTLLRYWAQAGALGDIVVIALGTNDAGLYSESTWISHWNEAIRLAGQRPVVFVTTKARAGSGRFAQQESYAGALRRWCEPQPRCFVADWALTAAANTAGSYYDDVHLRSAGTQARAAFIAAAVRALFDGAPIPNPQPLPAPTPTVPPEITTTTLVPPTTLAPATTSTTNAATTATTLPRTSTTTTAPPPTSTTTTTTTMTTTTTTTTVAPTTVAATTTTSSTPAP
jgi:peptidoglycan hydrolase-like protein with peptidoglycan-binding domain